ncbi:MAG: 4'-phosphopantetheinyl transferase superfamily protein [Pseudomonadota bacterium]
MTTFVLHIASDGVLEEQVEALRTRLPLNEAARADGMGWAERRTEFVLSRSLLRFGFAQIDPSGVDWRLNTTDHGKPVLAAGQHDALHLSIAHTQGLVCCALSTEVELGLDVERLSRASAIGRVKDRVFSAAELRELDLLPDDHKPLRLLSLWTGKEAVTKALGVGLGYDFRKLTMGFNDSDMRVVNEPGLAGWHFSQRLIEPDYRAALATQKDVGAQWRAVSVDALLDG